MAFSRQDFLDPYNVAHATLIPLTPAGRQLNLELDAALATAVNDWQVAEWLDPEPRLRASIAVSFENPPAAVAEIRRRAGDKRFVQVQFTGRPQEPMGRRKYWPIYEACVEHGLAVMSHAFGSYGQPITGTGWPSRSTYTTRCPARKRTAWAGTRSASFSSATMIAALAVIAGRTRESASLTATLMRKETTPSVRSPTAGASATTPV